jgi:hypothetical protein
MSDNIIGFPHAWKSDYRVDYEANPNEVVAPQVAPPPSEAWATLQDAANLIEGTRNVQHGAREKCHAEIAKLWTWWTGFSLDAHDVAIMMTLLKLSRIKTGGYNRDCYVDGEGYLAIAAELRKTESTPR